MNKSIVIHKDHQQELGMRVEFFGAKTTEAQTSLRRGAAVAGSVKDRYQAVRTVIRLTRPTRLSRTVGVALGCLLSVQMFAADTLRLDLQSCIQRAKRDGASARALRFDYASQCADHDAARADYLPQISLDASLPGYSRAIVPVLQPDGSYLNLAQTQTYSDASLNLSQKLPFSGGDLTLSSSLDNRANLIGDKSTNWSAAPFSIQLRQPITGFNPYSFARRADDLRFESQTRAYIEQMEDLSAQAAGRFFDYYIAGMNVENAKLNIALNDSINVLAKGRYNFGKIAENDLLQNELAVLSAHNDFERARLSRDRSLAALQLLLGISTQTIIIVETPPLAKELKIDIDKTLSYALAHRSEGVGFDMQALEADKSLALARVNNRFNASLVASYGLNQSASSMQSAYQNLLEQERLTLNVSLPLVTWGRTSSLVESAQAQRDKIDAMNALRRSELSQEIEFDLRDFQQLSSLLSIAGRAQTIATRRYEVARNRYIIGKIETTELMLSQREKDESQKSYYSSLRDYWVSYYKIRKTTLYDLENDHPITVQSED